MSRKKIIEAFESCFSSYSGVITNFSEIAQCAFYKLFVNNVPDGWVIESITANGKPPLFNKDTYIIDNASPTGKYRTEWQIGCAYGSPRPREVEVNFTLYDFHPIMPDEFLDRVIVGFAFPTNKVTAPINLLLLDE